MNQDLQARLSKYRLSQAEFEKMKSTLGREPQGVEWALFSALWSEHCSYKSSKVHLKKFAFKSPRVLQSMGENAGVIDLGQGEKIAFKMESHNHPSFIEPYEGAATGVGGILRDIFTMGARPIALANYLCFGEPQALRMPELVKGVVSGISGYGNCVGVPTITGQTEFHKSYNQNILVNALAVGYFGPEDPVVTSNAKGVGNWVVYVGAKTGRDGVHGASMASESFQADSAKKRPTVQIGDPFFEKLLIESCLEVMKQNLVVAIQDMGAAGLTSSSFEMAAKGGVGFKLHLDQVPLRDSSLGPEEILLSESQERMLLVCEPEKFKAIEQIFSHWGLDAKKLGEVTAGLEVELLWHGETLCKLDPKLLTDEAPVYQRAYEPWSAKKQVGQLKQPASENSQTETVTAERVNAALTSVQGCSRRWIYQQYDQRVGAATVRDCEDSVSVVRLKHSGRALALVLGCRPEVMRLDAKLGGYDAAFYPALELAAKGFEPLAMTDCLNFGNPEKSPVMSEFVAAVEALAEASQLLDAPVISGNVSFYNETLSQNITSTPATGLVGLRNSVENLPKSRFCDSGDDIYLLRFDQVHFRDETEFSGTLNTSDLSKAVLALPKFINQNPVKSSRVVGKFGLEYALARMCTESLGAKVNPGPWAMQTHDWSLQRLYEVLIVGPKSLEVGLKDWADKHIAKVWKIGAVEAGPLSLPHGRLELKKLRRDYESGWEKNFEVLA